MKYNNNKSSIDENNIITKINELSKNLEEIEKSIQEIEETKDIIIENITNIENNPNIIFNVFEGVNSDSINELTQILNYLNDNTKVEFIINKLAVRLDIYNQQKIENILKFLSINNVKYDNSPPVKIIIDKIKNVFINGKIDIYDIPAIINIVTSVLNIYFNFIIKVDIQILSIIIKFIIHMLIELKIISTNEIEESNINKLIDSSILLLNTTIITNSKYSFLSCCGKRNIK